MSDTELVCFRIPTPMLKELDRYAKNLAKKSGMRVTRTAAVREIFTKTLKAKSKK